MLASQPSNFKCGAPGRTRTSDTRFRKPLLCPLSYGGRAEVYPAAEGRFGLFRPRQARVRGAPSRCNEVRRRTDLVGARDRSSTRRNRTDKVRSGDGTEIAFERLGDGEAVILISGASTSRAVHASLAELLAADFTVLNYDRRGRGESGDTLPYAVEREIEDMGAVVTAAGGSAAVFGNSSGAVLALRAAAAGLPHHQAGDAGAGLLGQRETDVARLVADGLSNKQIGARLFISERTVDSHVHNILNKLGFDPRVQIAGWMASSNR